MAKPRNKLTAKQRKFCEEYLIDLNGKRAAIAAGYSKKTANKIASENLTKPDIQEYIQKLQQKAKDRNNISVDEILKPLIFMMRFDIRQLYDKEGNLKKVNDLDDETAQVISSIKSVTRQSDDDVIDFIDEYKTYDKTKAIDMLMKHLGGYERNNIHKIEVIDPFKNAD